MTDEAKSQGDIVGRTASSILATGNASGKPLIREAWYRTLANHALLRRRGR